MSTHGLIHHAGCISHTLSVLSNPVLAMRRSPSPATSTAVTLSSCAASVASGVQSRPAQALMLPSYALVSKYSPVLGAHFTQEMSRECAGMLYTVSCLRKSQMCTSRSSPAVARCTPLGAQSAANDWPMCADQPATALPERTSHTRTTPPKSVVASSEPSG